jgi:hypothetical protein
MMGARRAPHLAVHVADDSGALRCSYRPQGMYYEAQGKIDKAEELYEELGKEQPTNQLILKRVVGCLGPGGGSVARGLQCSRSCCWCFRRRRCPGCAARAAPPRLPARSPGEAPAARAAGANQRELVHPVLLPRLNLPPTPHPHPHPCKVAAARTRGDLPAAVDCLRTYVDYWMNDRDAWEELTELYLEVRGVQGAGGAVGCGRRGG